MNDAGYVFVSLGIVSIVGFTLLVIGVVVSVSLENRFIRKLSRIHADGIVSTGDGLAKLPSGYVWRVKSDDYTKSWHTIEAVSRWMKRSTGLRSYQSESLDEEYIARTTRRLVSVKVQNNPHLLGIYNGKARNRK